MGTNYEDFFGLPLSTVRHHDAPFQYEEIVAAISVLFMRSTFAASKTEPVALRWFFAIVLACLSFSRKSYSLIYAVEIFSYVVPLLLGFQIPFKTNVNDKVIRLVLIALSGIISMVICQSAASGGLMKLVNVLSPPFVTNAMKTLFPVDEFKEAYQIMSKFQNPTVLKQQIEHLFFVTFHIQFGIGYLGISFLKSEQERRNELVRMDTSTDTHETTSASITAKKDVARMEKAKKFQKGAAPFILFSAVPYMIQIIFYGNINKFAFSCWQHDMHRNIRLNELFDQDNHLHAMAAESPTTPEAYALSMDKVTETTYELFNRKLFSLPKVLLLPGVISKTPQMIAQIFPFIFLSDWAKGRAITYMTTRVEDLQKEIKELSSVRGAIEAFDIKNAELLQRSGKGAMKFTQMRWESLTLKIQAKSVVSDLITRTKGFFAFIQRNFVFSVLVDCALANLIGVGKIVSSEIFVFSRAIEDAVDMVLMRSRSEAELARMMTEIEKLTELANIWARSKSRNLLHCKVAKREEDGITLRHVHYSRGTATVRAEHVEIRPGIYALTGANGSGKSTLFRVLMSCDTNEKSIDLPSSISFSTPSVSLVEVDDLEDESSCELTSKQDDDATETAGSKAEAKEGECYEGDDNTCSATFSKTTEAPSSTALHVPKLAITMPSSHVVEISFYWPLYTKPIDWIYQEHASEGNNTELEARLRRTAEELQSMSFFQAPAVTGENDGGDTEEEEVSAVDVVIQQLNEEKEDWFNDLSGGQKSKVELVRKVFLMEHCPNVVLIDETFAPLDPTSKSLVMKKIKDFCRESVVIVIYHADIGHGQETSDGEKKECIPSSNFFDHNLHLENSIIEIRPVC